MRLESNGKEVFFAVVADGKGDASATLHEWFGFKYAEYSEEDKIRKVACADECLVPYLANAKVTRPSMAAMIEAAVDPKPYKILPDLELYLGSQDAAASAESLTTHGITDVLNVATGIDYEKLPTVTYHNVPVLDVPEADIYPILVESNKIMDAVFAKGGKVLVHCNAGVSRSTSVVISCIMKLKGMSFEETYAVVKAAKPDVNPNQGFVETLRTRWMKE